MSDARLRRWLTRFLPHVDERSIALTGGSRSTCTCRNAVSRAAGMSSTNVDYVAAGGDTVSSSVATHFLVSHFHHPQPGYPKFLIQLVDQASRDVAFPLAPKQQIYEVLGYV